MGRRLLICCALVLGCTCSVFAQNDAPPVPTPDDSVRMHFAAIEAEEYVAADALFSQAFYRAFKGDLAAMDNYYLTRREQLSHGYSISIAVPLADEDKDTTRVTVEFHDPDPHAVIGISERMYYYLVREKVDADSPLRDNDGRAWRIDIFDALSYETLAEARRRPYLYTREAWPEDESRELRSRQGLFRIQLALATFYREHGEYPFRLRGGDNRRDELIRGGYLREHYPANGWGGQPMKTEEFGKKSSGDFAYYSVDADGDGRREGYWLLLHGKRQDGFYFAGKDTVYILGTAPGGTQLALAGAFAGFWLLRAGEHLQLKPDVPGLATLEPTGSWLEPVASPHETARAAGETPVILVPPESVEQIEPLDITGPADAPVDDSGTPDAPAEVTVLPTVARVLAMARARIAAQSLLRTVGELQSALTVDTAGSDQPAEDPEPAPAVEPDERLRVYHYGW